MRGKVKQHDMKASCPVELLVSDPAVRWVTGFKVLLEIDFFYYFVSFRYSWNWNLGGKKPPNTT